MYIFENFIIRLLDLYKFIIEIYIFLSLIHYVYILALHDDGLFK